MHVSAVQEYGNVISFMIINPSHHLENKNKISIQLKNRPGIIKFSNYRQCWWMQIYLWLAIAKAVSRWRLKLFHAAKMSDAHTHLSGIKKLQLFECLREWRDVTRDKLTVGIGFHTRILPPPSPLVSVYRFTSASHHLQWDSLHYRLHNRGCFVILL